MKCQHHRILRVLLAMAPAAISGHALANVSLSLDIGHGYDFYYPGINLTATSPDPVTYHRVESPNGIIWKNAGSNSEGSTLLVTNSLDAVLGECNGLWKLYLNKGDASEELYHFTVSITGVTTNVLGDVTILNPLSGSSGVTNRPVFEWTGPTDFASIYVDVYHATSGSSYTDSLPGTATNWMPAGSLTVGNNSVLVDYINNDFAGFSFTTPTNSSGALSGWTSRGTIFSYKHSSFAVVEGGVGGGAGGHTNIAHYTFDDGSSTFALGLDSSPRSNHIATYSYWGPVHTNTVDALAGANAVEFFGTSSLVPVDNTLTNLSDVLVGSFTVSAWVKTTDSRGNDADHADAGAILFWALNDVGYTNDTIPLAITGSKAAFSTRDSLGTFTTVHSTTTVNDGAYHLVTVTRDQTTGDMRMYVDGSLEASAFGTTEPLNGNDYFLSVGGTPGSSFVGLADDLQVYSGVLSSAEIGSLHSSPGTTIPDVAGIPTGDLVAHYAFDEGNVVAADISGHANDLVLAGNFGGTGPAIDTDHVAGSGGAIRFDGGSFLTAPTNLLSTLAGSFTVSLWLKTTQDNGNPNALAWTGDAILSADIPSPGANDLIPAALTGGQVAFNTANTEGDYDHTLNSVATVSDGVWHHVVISRNQPTGAKFIYIDGLLDATDVDSTNLLNDARTLTLGCKADASNPDPSSPSSTGSNGYDGLLDDLQFYRRALSSDEVAFLHANPGTTLRGNDFNVALNTTNLSWTASGDLNWFIENAITFDGDSAVQSGAITHGQTTRIETTVPSGGELSFYWKVSSEAEWDYLTFYINDTVQDAISGDVDWIQAVYAVAAGDRLRWEYSKDNSVSDLQDAGWLDQVVLPAGGASPYPVDVDLQLTIVRAVDPGWIGEYFLASVSFNSVFPEPATTNRVQSPNNLFNSAQYPSGGFGGSAILGSLSEVVDECTNGPWRIYINQGSPTQQVYSFRVSISDLDTNLLAAVSVSSPAHGAVNVPTNPTFSWDGPSNFTTLVVDLLSGPSTGLPVSATSWLSAPTLGYGPDRFDVSYTSNNFPGITFSVPVDASANPLRSWTASANLSSQAFSHFVVGAPAPLPVAITNLTVASDHVEFSFQTLAGRPHTVQARTNLIGDTWHDLTNFTGDGSLKPFLFPATSPPTQFFRIKTQ